MSIKSPAVAVLLLVASPALAGGPAGGGTGGGDQATGKQTTIVSDTLKEKKTSDGKTVYEETIEVKNTTASDITTTITSQPYSKVTPRKFKEVEKDGKVTYVPADGVPGAFGTQQSEKGVKIPAGQSKTVTFTWSEKFKWRYSDVYVDDSSSADSFTNTSVFDVGSLSPFDPLKLPRGALGTFDFDQPFFDPLSVLADLGGGPVDFFIDPEKTVLPAGWSAAFITPPAGTDFTLDWTDFTIPVQVALDLSTPAIPGQTALISYYIVQPDEGYHYHITDIATVVPEPSAASTIMGGLFGIATAVALRRRRA